jgi:hypothetical protein
VSERLAVNQERLHCSGPSSRWERREVACSSTSRQRLTAVAALALLRRDRAPEFVDDSARVASDLVDVAFEMGCPQSRVACERRVAGDDVG